MIPTPNKGTVNAAALKREALREQVWPGSSAEVWNRKVGKGFTTIPRTLGLIMTLIEELAERKKGHAVSRVYFELWCRAFDEGFLDGPDEESCAFAAGFTTERSVRSWKERIDTLVELGFVRVAPRGTRPQGYILILDPHKVVKNLHAAKRVRPEWWGAYIKRCSEIGYTLP
jgi:hypothetical protein